MIGINQTLQTSLNCRYRTVTAGLCPTLDQEDKSMLTQAPRTIETRDDLPKTDLLAVQTNVHTATLTNLQSSTGLQSP
jgi:hypothetical protein